MSAIVHCLLEIEEEPCSRKNILLNYLVLNKKFSFALGNFVVCYSSVPVVIPCQLHFSETYFDKFRLHYISERGSSIASLEYFRKC